MARSRVTSKYQVTIPKQVRDRVEVRPGEVVSVEAVSEDEIVLRLFPRTSAPLKTLIGKGPPSREVAVEELEERIESR